MYPRAKAFGLALHHERLLVQEYHTDDETYYRPLGGSIELGEKSEITAELEMLADESYKKQKIKEDHEASHHLNANKF